MSILQRLDDTDDLYIDRVGQIRMGIALLLEPRAGGARRRCGVLRVVARRPGSALAMVSAYLLAGELPACADDYVPAFDHYEQRLAPFVLKKQNAALRFGGFFAPRSATSLFLRNQAMKLLAVPWLADVVVGRDIPDGIALPALG